MIINKSQMIRVWDPQLKWEKLTLINERKVESCNKFRHMIQLVSKRKSRQRALIWERKQDLVIKKKEKQRLTNKTQLKNLSMNLLLLIILVILTSAHPSKCLKEERAKLRPRSLSRETTLMNLKLKNLKIHPNRSQWTIQMQTGVSSLEKKR